MWSFLGRRLAFNLAVQRGVLLLLHRQVTGDPAAAYLPLDADAEQVAALRSRLGLDEPFPVQFVEFVGRALQGDFGDSYRQRQPAMELVFERMPATLELGAVGLVIALFVGAPLGAVAALRKGTAIDRAARMVAVVGQAAPDFWVGLLLLLVLGVRLGWLPISGIGGWQHLVMPGLVIALPTIPIVVRIFRSSILGVLDQNYIRTARAKGLASGQIFRRHIVRNASIPIVTVTSFEISSILSGALIAEVIFAYPGMAQLSYTAIVNRDMAVVQSFVVVVSLVVVTTNLLLDLCYALLDPRVRVA
jgi:peptide/nickel transport system permease protein